MSWDTYVHQIQNTFDASINNWSVTNVCLFAAVYGLDGALWASSEGFQLATYEYDLAQEDGSTKKVTCNEHSAAVKASGGDRKGGQECGVRICNQKYMFINSGSEESVQYCILSRQGGGGATIAKTGKCILVGVWGKDSPMSNGKTQNTGDCQKNVLTVGKALASAGF